MPINARSRDRFPSLAGPACPWHDDCTPMDCENHRTLRNAPSSYSEGIGQPRDESLDLAYEQLMRKNDEFL